MNKLKGIISIIGVIAKYGAVLIAVVKGIDLVHEELKKIDFTDVKKDVEPVKEVQQNE